MALTTVGKNGRTLPYQSKSFALAPAASDVDMKGTVSGAFVGLPESDGAIIVTDADISVKINATTNDAIPITAAQQSLTLPKETKISNMFFSSTPGANLTVVLL